MSNRIKSSEAIPLGSIGSIEIKAPTMSLPNMCTFKITSAANVDLIYVLDGPWVKPFVDATNAAIAGSRNGSEGTASSDASSVDTVATKITMLAELHAQGLLTDDEYSRKKAEILSEL